MFIMSCARRVSGRYRYTVDRYATQFLASVFFLGAAFNYGLIVSYLWFPAPHMTSSVHDWYGTDARKLLVREWD